MSKKDIEVINDRMGKPYFVKTKKISNIVQKNFKEKNFKVAALLLMVMPFQIFGYGLGFIVAYIKRYILKHKEFPGFQRNFY